MKDIKAVFDIGNDVIKGVILADDNWKDVVLVKQIEKTKWMRKWKILDIETFTQTINTITENFIKKLGGDFIDEVFVSISHPETKIQRVKEQKRIMNEEIQAEDVNHLSKIVADISIINNYETIKIIPVHRLIDEKKKEKDPIGLQWKKLDLIADVFMIPKNFYNTIIETFEKVWLHVVDIIPNIVSATEVVLDYDHKDLWCILIDIGKNQTSYVIYEDGYPLWYWILPLWSEDVTKDISIWMQVDIKEAELIKKSHWTAIIENKQNPEDSTLDIHFLSDIINARYEEIFLKINKHLEKLDKDRRLPWGILLIGGGARMPNIDLLAKDTFKLATFFWKDNILNLWDLSTNLQFINVLWTYVWSNKYIEGRKMNFKLKLDFLWNIWNFFKDLF